jgi:hypothetical protein
MPGKKVFVSSGLGFTFPGRAFLSRTLHPMLTGNGFELLDQWASERAAQPDRSTVAASNVQLLLAADAVLAILDGPDIDSGTAAEIGFASAAGTPVVGYRTDVRSGVPDKVLHAYPVSSGTIGWCRGQTSLERSWSSSSGSRASRRAPSTCLAAGGRTGSGARGVALSGPGRSRSAARCGSARAATGRRR